ncbi:hypothetical protein QVG61_11875 [Thiohalobacter sp. IOR34]|uniref:hypothetical protein n=1 Tax=Thiohalobacter sp. IOR34 TaxID=3057176 RepID=UPI0025B0BF1E|nr:hypothetical protein [Thiohalobacter sp. IOR34]WJW75175.1 hypothetical protein QVG61_11875 [Thiohalobacter sp. IOR34]
MAQNNHQRPAFVIAATLAGHLYRVMHIAKLMSLSASNAKGVAARAGEKAMGFRPITDFIAEMANDTIHHATRINQHALSVSRTSVASQRSHIAKGHLEQTRRKLEGQRRKAYLDELIGAAEAKHDALEEDIRETIHILSLELEEIRQGMRGANIIVTNSRTEAARAGEFRPYLESIASSVEEAANDIQKEIGACRSLIEQLKHAS